MKTRITAILLSLSMLLCAFALSGCKKKLELSDYEADMILRDLVPRSHALNVIFFGEGLKAVDSAYEKEHSETAYFEVSKDENYTSIQEIKNVAELVYSKKYLSEIYIPAFEGIEKTENDGALDTSVSPRYKEINGKLSVDVSNKGLEIRGRTTVISAWVTEKTHEYVRCEAICLDEDGKSFNTEFLLTYENDIWVLHSPTY